MMPIFGTTLSFLPHPTLLLKPWPFPGGLGIELVVDEFEEKIMGNTPQSPFQWNLAKEARSTQGIDYKAQNLDFHERLKPLEKRVPYIEPIDLTETKTPRFVGLSLFMHGGLLFLILTMAVPLIEAPKVETISIEIAEPTPGPIPGAGGQEALSAGASSAAAPVAVPPPTMVAPPTPAPTARPISHDDVLVKATPTAPVTPPKPIEKPKAAKPVVAVKPAPPAKPVVRAAPVRKSSPARVAVAPVHVPVTDENSEVETPSAEKPLMAPVVRTNVNERFQKIQQEDQQSLENLKTEMDQDAERSAQSGEAMISKLDQDNESESQQMAEQQAALKRRNAEEIAAAKAQAEAAQAAERAEQNAHAQARVAADREAAEARAAAARDAANRAAAAKAAAIAAAQQGDGGEGHSLHGKDAQGDNDENIAGLTDQGQGSGAAGPTNATGSAAGGVRSLESLRQMPGNPRPAYSEQERYAKQQGTVTYWAYISKDGLPTQFQQRQTTGHANLDGKTLDALKKWKFYPGQEGWVEIPFKWDLRGGPKEVSAARMRVNEGAH